MAKDDRILGSGSPATRTRLDYAPQRGDGHARFNAAVEHAFTPGRGGPGSLLRFFDGDPERTAWFFGKQLTRRFASNSLTDFCNGCGRAGVEHGVVCWWRIEFRRSDFVIVRGYVPAAPAKGRTMHTLCRPCWLRIEGRELTGRFVGRWALYTLASLWAAVALTFGIAHLSGTVIMVPHGLTVVSVLVASLVLVVTHHIATEARRFSVPQGIRHQLPRGVTLDFVYDWLPRFRLADSSQAFGARDGRA